MEAFILSTVLQMVIILGFFVLLLIAVGFSMLYFSRCQELKLIYAILNIVSLILLLVYVFFLYKQSSPIACSIIDSILSDMRNPQLIPTYVFCLIGWIYLALSSCSMLSITILIPALFAKVLGVIFFSFLFLVEKIYSIVHKFIHWLRNLFNLSKDK